MERGGKGNNDAKIIIKNFNLRETHDFAPKFDVFAPKISRLILFEFASSVFMNSRLFLKVRKFLNSRLLV